MELKSKLNNLKELLQKKSGGVGSTDIGDLPNVYKKLLKKLPDISHLKNIVFFSGIATLLIFVLFANRFATLYEYLPKKPQYGGTYVEGVVGDIKQLNPVYSPVNSAEAGAVSLIFSGLTKKGPGRKVNPDLAENWEVTSDGRTYVFHLKEGLKWQDGMPLTAADVVFTVNTIQDPDVGSPYLNIWKGVVVENPEERRVVFRLPEAYAPFLSVTDLPIIPEHILRDIPARNLSVSEFSGNPVGSGPFKFEKLKEIKDSGEVHLTRNDNYYGKKPYLENVIIKTYHSFSSLTNAYVRRDIMGMERVYPRELEKKSQLPNFATYELAIPEYDVVYFNLRSRFKDDKVLREAISLTIEREKIINEVYSGHATPIYSPILPGYLGYNKAIKGKENLRYAKAKLKEDKSYKYDRAGNLTKSSEIVTLRLVIPESENKIKEANLIKEMVEKLGVKVEIEKYPLQVFLEDYIRPRNFDMVLLSQNLGADPDIYSFWHKSQSDDPGLNLSGLSDTRIDKYLEDARKVFAEKERMLRYRELATFIAEEDPAIFICWPGYLYGISKDVKGVQASKLTEPKDRFYNISDWYLLQEKDY